MKSTYVPMVTLGEMIPDETWKRLRFRVAFNGLTNAFKSFGDAAVKASKVNWPAEMLTDEKLSPWSQQKHGL